jgi:hypothetical protein
MVKPQITYWGNSRMPNFRKATWAIIIWCALILIWAIAGGASSDCGTDTTYQGACEAGTGIGVILILILGFFGFVFLSLIWLMSRPKSRLCPQCGNDVKKGLISCPSCGLDFSQIGGAVPPPLPPPPSDPTRPPPPTS